MDLVLIVVLVLLLFGGGVGWRTGAVAVGNPLSIILIVVLILLLVGLLGPRMGLRGYW
jgi:hypothetical protein